MSLTGAQLLEGMSRFLGDWWSSSTTSAGNGGGTTLVDTTLGRFGDDAIRDMYLRVTQSGSNQYIIRRITDFVSSTGTCTVSPAFPAQVGSGDTYELHRYDPQDKFESLDLARLEAVDDVYTIVRDDTITANGVDVEYTIPSSIRFGPEVAIVESPLSANAGWNVLQDADGTAIDAWTAASGVAASVVTRTPLDPIVPKVGRGNAVKLVYTDGGSDGTFTQTVSAMKSDMSAALAAGRTMEFGVWIYSLDGTTVVEFLDDSGTVATSTAHQGLGWEFLSASGDVSVTNATTLSVRVRFPTTGSANRLVYLQDSYFAFNQIPEQFFMESAVRVERDDTLNKFILRDVPPAGRNIRCVGRGTLSALGTTVSAQPTNTMEVDEAAAQILYAAASRILLGHEMLNTPAMNNVARRIGWVDANRTKLARVWRMSEKDLRMIPPFNA